MDNNRDDEFINDCMAFFFGRRPGDYSRCANRSVKEECKRHRNAEMSDDFGKLLEVYRSSVETDKQTLDGFAAWLGAENTGDFVKSRFAKGDFVYREAERINDSKIWRICRIENAFFDFARKTWGYELRTVMIDGRNVENAYRKVDTICATENELHLAVREPISNVEQAKRLLGTSVSNTSPSGTRCIRLTELKLDGDEISFNNGAVTARELADGTWTSDEGIELFNFRP